MRLPEVTRPITYLKTRAAELLRTVERTRRPVVITQNGEARGVVLDVASYEELRDAAMMLKLLAQGEEDVRGGRTVPQEEVFRSVRSHLA